MRTDMPYAALSGRDPELQRQHVFFVFDMQQGVRAPDLAKAFGTAGLGKIRINFLSAATAFVELLEPQNADETLPALQSASIFKIMTYQQYTTSSYWESNMKTTGSFDLASRKRRREDQPQQQPAAPAADAPSKLCAIM